MPGFSDIGKNALNDPRNRAALVAAGASPGMLPMDPEEPTKADIKTEKALQDQCEQYLSLHGYWRLTAESAAKVWESDVECQGFFGHFRFSQRSPLMPDLMIIKYPNDRPALLIELKIKPIQWQPGQSQMCDLCFWVLCLDLEAFKDLVGKWEMGI